MIRSKFPFAIPVKNYIALAQMPVADQENLRTVAAALELTRDDASQFLHQVTVQRK